MIDGKEFATAPMNNLIELPQHLQPRNTAEKQNGSVLYFLGSHSVFSNMHKVPFQFDDTHDSCAEQYIQCSKAQLFDDALVHNKFMRETDPYKIKQIGSRVKN